MFPYLWMDWSYEKSWGLIFIFNFLMMITHCNIYLINSYHQRQIQRGITRLMPTTEKQTNFTFLCYRTCILLFISINIFHYFYVFYFIITFYFSSFCLLFFILFICLIASFDWFSLFSFSYCILIFLLSLHLYSNNTLLFVFYFLFFLLRSYISCHIIVVSVLL